MKHDDKAPEGRRHLLQALAVAPLATIGSMGLIAPTLARADPTPECGEKNEPTLRQTAGPFYKPRSPQRTSLIDSGMKGEILMLTGLVLSTSCQPVAGAVLDFWHCDSKGDYDLSGFRFRGHQLSGADGAFRLATILPGVYPGRARHIHVKVQAPNRPVLTTQLYFPGEADNSRDFIFRPELLMKLSRAAQSIQGRFDFVLDLG